MQDRNQIDETSCDARPDHTVGSEADVQHLGRFVCFTPKADITEQIDQCPLRAKSRPNAQGTNRYRRRRRSLLAILSAGLRSRQRDMRLILVPSSVRLYISPLPSKMNPTMGLPILDVSTEPAAPTLISVTDPSTPTFQPSIRWKPANASSVINTMMMDRACAPS